MLYPLVGYAFHSVLVENDKTIIVRATRGQDGKPVVLKYLKDGHCSGSTRACFQQEYELLASLSEVEGVTRCHGLVEHGRTLALVLEEFPGHTLRQLAAEGALGVGAILAMGMSLASILAQIHDAGVIHKDITPSNILVNPTNSQVCIVDFGIAASAAAQNLGQAGMLQGNPKYIAPEQTGRVHRPLDHRTDLYALGVVLYEALIGRPPFDEDDPLALIHCHIARIPTPPCQLRLDIPPILSDILMRLLQKNPKDRYQSGRELATDLATCLEQWRAHASIRPFDLGARQGVARLVHERKLFGREKEFQRLREIFSRVSVGQGWLVLVSGLSGVGKTALVAQFLSESSGRSCLSISGKYGQMQASAPFSALGQAFKALAMHVLGGKESELGRWRERIMAELHPNAQLLIDIVPELGLVLGPQPQAQEVGPLDAQGRLYRLLEKFIALFCSPQAPLIIFLDDLQWADTSTIGFVEYLFRGQALTHFMLLGAYRSNEVEATHPFMHALQGLRLRQPRPEEITLDALEAGDVAAMLASGLSLTPQETVPLATLLRSKTGGNPFFIKQLLARLEADGLLVYDPAPGRWTWNIETIAAADFADEVAILLAQKLRTLPLCTVEALELAACIGPDFDLRTLHLACDRSPAQLVEDLLPALREGLVASAAADYRFAHDAVHQAAYEHMAPARRAAAHHGLGRRLLDHLPEAERQERLFEVTDHLNNAIERLSSVAEREELAVLDLEAGKRAFAAAAYAAALRYFETGIQLLPETTSEESYALWFDLYASWTLAMSLNGFFDEAEALVRAGQAKAASPLDRVRLLSILVEQEIMRARFPQAIATGLQALALLGLVIQEQDLEQEAARLRPEVERLFLDRDVFAWRDIPKSSDRTQALTIEIISKIALTSYLTRRELWRVIILTGLKLSIEQGNVPESGGAYLCYGIMVIEDERQYELGVALGELALRVQQAFDNQAYTAMVQCMFAMQKIHWHLPLEVVASALGDASRKCLASGSFTYAGWSMAAQITALMAQGRNLLELRHICTEKLESCQKLNNFFARPMLVGLGLVLGNLAGAGASYDAFQDESVSEDELVQECLATHNFHALLYFHVTKAFACSLYGRHEQALAALDAATPFLSFGRALLIFPDYVFNQSLILAARPEGSLEQIRSNLALLRQWAKLAPTTFAHRFHLVQAELARRQGQDMDAAQAYALAIDAAAAHKCTHIGALANELAGKFWLAKKNKKIATLYLTDAYHGYKNWGATLKLRHLRETYPEVLVDVLPFWQQGSGRPTTIEDGTQVLALQTLELASVIKASQAISSEIVLERLLERLIVILVESAGATKGALFLISNGGLALALLARVEGGEIVVAPPGRASEEAPLSIVRSVQANLAPIVLADAAADAAYGVDPYMRRVQPRSILCAPLLLHAEAQGLIYLENTLTPYSFTRDRLETVQMLASQAAISLESARFLAELQAAEAKYHAIFDYSPAGIFQATPQGRLLHMNQTVADILGYATAAEVLAADPDGTHHLFIDQGMFGKLLAQTYAEDAVSGVEAQMRRKDGGAVWIGISARLLRAADGSPERIEGFIADISARKAAEKEIRELNRRLLSLQEDERQRLSRDLHDDVAQDLVSLKIGYEILRQDCPSWALEVAGRLVQLSTRLQKALDKVRDLSHMLRPPDFERLGLVRSLEILCLEMADEQELEVAFSAQGLEEVQLGAEAEINLYRLVQEALNNVKKHAQASRVEIALGASSSDVLVRIKDNGRGFDVAAHPERRKHLGLKTMQERARQLGGVLRLDSKPGSGVEIIVSFPVTGDAHA